MVRSTNVSLLLSDTREGDACSSTVGRRQEKEQSHTSRPGSSRRGSSHAAVAAAAEPPVAGCPAGIDAAADAGSAATANGRSAA